MDTYKRSIFRNKALEHYIQSREQNTLPRITRAPVFFCMWALLGLSITALVLACLSEVPVYINGSGVVTGQDATVLIFLPTSPGHPWQIRPGTPVYVQIASQSIRGTIDEVEPGIISPDDAQKRYGLGEEMVQTITGPSMVAMAHLQAGSLSQGYTGSLASVQVQVGTTRVLSLIVGSATSSGE